MCCCDAANQPQSYKWVISPGQQAGRAVYKYFCVVDEFGTQKRRKWSWEHEIFVHLAIHTLINYARSCFVFPTTPPLHVHRVHARTTFGKLQAQAIFATLFKLLNACKTSIFNVIFPIILVSVIATTRCMVTANDKECVPYAHAHGQLQFPCFVRLGYSVQHYYCNQHGFAGCNRNCQLHIL